MGNLTIDIKDYISEERFKEIAEEELRNAFQRCLRKEGDVEIILTNIAYFEVFKYIDSLWDGRFEEVITKRIKETIAEMPIYYIFRKDSGFTYDKNSGEKVPYIGDKILAEEIENHRDMIKARIEEIIKEYPFNELKRDEIGDVVYECIMDRLFRKEKS